MIQKFLFKSKDLHGILKNNIVNVNIKKSIHSISYKFKINEQLYFLEYYYSDNSILLYKNKIFLNNIKIKIGEINTGKYYNNGLITNLYIKGIKIIYKNENLNFTYELYNSAQEKFNKITIILLKKY